MPSTFETFRARCLAAGITYEDNVGWYSDRYSCVIYKEMQTINGFEPVPLLAVYTQKIGSEQYNYAGVVSLEYNFVGNESLVDSITRSITDIGSSVLDENPTLNGTLTGMINEIVLRDTNEIPNVGDVYPHVTLINSYNGTRQAEVSFGITMIDASTGSRHNMTFRQTFGMFKQIHVANARTSLNYTMENTVKSINENIADFIKVNTETKIDERTLLSTLDLVEKVGKKRRDEVSNYIKNLAAAAPGREITSWDLFLAISKFSSVEKNLNAKIVLEDIVERIMILPAKMINSLQTINSEPTLSQRAA